MFKLEPDVVETCDLIRKELSRGTIRFFRNPDILQMAQITDYITPHSYFCDEDDARRDSYIYRIFLRLIRQGGGLSSSLTSDHQLTHCRVCSQIYRSRGIRRALFAIQPPITENEPCFNVTLEDQWLMNCGAFSTVITMRRPQIPILWSVEYVVARRLVQRLFNICEGVRLKNILANPLDQVKRNRYFAAKNFGVDSFPQGLFCVFIQRGRRFSSTGTVFDELLAIHNSCPYKTCTDPDWLRTIRQPNNIIRNADGDGPLKDRPVPQLSEKELYEHACRDFVVTFCCSRYRVHTSAVELMRHVESMEHARFMSALVLNNQQIVLERSLGSNWISLTTEIVNNCMIHLPQLMSMKVGVKSENGQLITNSKVLSSENHESVKTAFQYNGEVRALIIQCEPSSESFRGSTIETDDVTRGVGESEDQAGYVTRGVSQSEDQAGNQGLNDVTRGVSESEDQAGYVTRGVSQSEDQAGNQGLNDVARGVSENEDQAGDVTRGVSQSKDQAGNQGLNDNVTLAESDRQSEYAADESEVTPKIITQLRYCQFNLQNTKGSLSYSKIDTLQNCIDKKPYLYLEGHNVDNYVFQIDHVDIHVTGNCVRWRAQLTKGIDKDGAFWRSPICTNENQARHGLTMAYKGNVHGRDTNCFLIIDPTVTQGITHMYIAITGSILFLDSFKSYVNAANPFNFCKTLQIIIQCDEMKHLIEWVMPEKSITTVDKMYKTLFEKAQKENPKEFDIYVKGLKKCNEDKEKHKKQLSELRNTDRSRPFMPSPDFTSGSAVPFPVPVKYVSDEIQVEESQLEYSYCCTWEEHRQSEDSICFKSRDFPWFIANKDVVKSSSELIAIESSLQSLNNKYPTNIVPVSPELNDWILDVSCSSDTIVRQSKDQAGALKQCLPLTFIEYLTNTLERVTTDSLMSTVELDFLIHCLTPYGFSPKEIVYVTQHDQLLLLNPDLCPKKNQPNILSSQVLQCISDSTHVKAVTWIQFLPEKNHFVVMVFISSLEMVLVLDSLCFSEYVWVTEKLENYSKEDVAKLLKALNLPDVHEFQFYLWPVPMQLGNTCYIHCILNLFAITNMIATGSLFKPDVDRRLGVVKVKFLPNVGLLTVSPPVLYQFLKEKSVRSLPELVFNGTLGNSDARIKIFIEGLKYYLDECVKVFTKHYNSGFLSAPIKKLIFPQTVHQPDVVARQTEYQAGVKYQIKHQPGVEAEKTEDQAGPMENLSCAQSVQQMDVVKSEDQAGIKYQIEHQPSVKDSVKEEKRENEGDIQGKTVTIVDANVHLLQLLHRQEESLSATNAVTKLFALYPAEVNQKSYKYIVICSLGMDNDLMVFWKVWTSLLAKSSKGGESSAACEEKYEGFMEIVRLSLRLENGYFYPEPIGHIKLYYTIGLHPITCWLHDIKQHTLNIMKIAIKHPVILAIGKVGLDKILVPIDPQSTSSMTYNSALAQTSFLSSVLDIVSSSKKPVVLHVNPRADDPGYFVEDLHMVLKGMKRKNFEVGRRAIVHSPPYVNLGFVYSQLAQPTYLMFGLDLMDDSVTATQLESLIRSGHTDFFLLQSAAGYLETPSWIYTSPGKSLINAYSRLQQVFKNSLNFDEVSAALYRNACDFFMVTL